MKTSEAKPAGVYLVIGLVYCEPLDRQWNKFTDKDMKLNKIFAGVIVALVLLAGTPFILGLIWPRINDVSTGATPQYPDIQPQKFNQPPEKVLEAAVETSKTMGWDIIEIDRNRGVIEAVATTRIFRFKDDVTVGVERAGEATIVNIRSHSRVGKGDLGANARRIRAFQAELAKRL
jgi:uncharacterized protein (DUF1499 family)